MDFCYTYDSLHRLPNIWIKVNRIDKLDLRVKASKLRYGTADRINPSPKFSRRCPVMRTIWKSFQFAITVESD